MPMNMVNIFFKLIYKSPFVLIGGSERIQLITLILLLKFCHMINCLLKTSLSVNYFCYLSLEFIFVAKVLCELDSYFHDIL